MSANEGNKPKDLHFMLVETSAKSLLDQFRLVVSGTPQHLETLERIEFYIEKFFVDNGLKEGKEEGTTMATAAKSEKKKKKTKRTSLLGATTNTSDPLRMKRSSILMSQATSSLLQYNDFIEEFVQKDGAQQQQVLLLKNNDDDVATAAGETGVTNHGTNSGEESGNDSKKDGDLTRLEATNKMKTSKIDNIKRDSGSYRISPYVTSKVIPEKNEADDDISASSVSTSTIQGVAVSQKVVVVNENEHDGRNTTEEIGEEEDKNESVLEKMGGGLSSTKAGVLLPPLPSTTTATTLPTTIPLPAIPLLGPSTLPEVKTGGSGFENADEGETTAPPSLLPPPPRFMWEQNDAALRAEEGIPGSGASSPVVKKGVGVGPAAEISHVSAVDALLLQASSKWFTFSPHNRYKAYWDFFMMFTVIYIAVLLPTRLAFDVHVSGFEKGVDVTLDLLFIGDIILNFMAGYIDPATKDVVMDWNRIARRYASSWLLLDVVSSVPTDVIDAARGDWESSSGPLKMLKLMKVFRMLRVLRMHSFKTLERSGRANPNVIRIFKFVAAFGFSLHFSACAYWAVARWEGLGETAWVPAVEFDGSAFGDQYIKSVHYALASMMVNDMKPETPTELWFSCCIMLIGLVVNATIIGSAASLLSNLNAGAVERKKQLDAVREYMSFRKVPQSLQKRITEYYEYMWDCGQNSHNEDLFDDLPPALLMRLRLSLSRELINNISMFQALDPSVVLALVLRMEASITIPDEVIIREGEVGHCMYFINRGAVQVSIKQPGGKGKPVEIATLKKGSYFGEIALMDAEHERTATVTSVTYCELYSLDQEAWSEIVESRNGFFAALNTTAHDRYSELTNFKKNQKRNRGMFMSDERKSTRRRASVQDARGFLGGLLKTGGATNDERDHGGVFDATMRAAADVEIPTGFTDPHSGVSSPQQQSSPMLSSRGGGSAVFPPIRGTNGGSTRRLADPGGGSYVYPVRSSTTMRLKS